MKDLTTNAANLLLYVCLGIAFLAMTYEQIRTIETDNRIRLQANLLDTPTLKETN